MEKHPVPEKAVGIKQRGRQLFERGRTILRRQKREKDTVDPEKIWAGLSSPAKHIATALRGFIGAPEREAIEFTVGFEEEPQLAEKFDAGLDELISVGAIKEITTEKELQEDVVDSLSSRFGDKDWKNRNTWMSIERKDRLDFDSYVRAQEALTRYEEFLEEDTPLRQPRYRLAPPFQTFIDERYGDRFMPYN